MPILGPEAGRSARAGRESAHADREKPNRGERENPGIATRVFHALHLPCRPEGDPSDSQSRTLFFQLPLSKWNVIGLFRSGMYN